MYEPRRNIVTRSDGRPVNVARSRGQLFVCADACCCGRVEDGIAPVPRNLYHAEWERRRLRNIVHLTVGGCLGPCALANVTLLLFDGRALWFHSINTDALVLALYDYIEAILDADGHLPPPSPLAERLFTGHTWQPRPDGLAVDDRRIRDRRALTPGLSQQRRDARRREPQPGVVPNTSAPNSTPNPSVLPLSQHWERGSGGEGASADPPRKNGELVFDEPWQGRAFGMAVALNEGQCYPWDDFRDHLVAEIAEGDARDDPSGYYERWLAAFERLLAEQGIVTKEELDERTFEFEFGERDDVF